MSETKPTIEEDLGPEFTQALHGLAAIVLLADKMSDRRDGYVLIPEDWWNAHVIGMTDKLNEIARRRCSGSS